MIKVNLLAANLIKKEERNELFVLACILAAIIVLLGGAGYGSKLYSNMKLEKRIEVANRELTKYESIVRQVEALQSTKTVLETKKNLINTLSATGLTYPVFMEKLMSVLPDNIWFKSVNTKTLNDTDLSISMDAEALDNYAIADFISFLSTDKSFSNIELGQITTAGTDKMPTYSFKMTANYRKEIKK
ncbi:MAG: PilN domain-containing protein [Elusimicrobia bacterium]|nr:PilN domain-containing protein [Candidatus Liberimonas magnetica]